jgi:alkylation response protein AidB-like acyl-CoA dehydrogenase
VLADALTQDALLERLEALVTPLRERAPETERLRQLPEATISDALDSGFLGAFRPSAYGGSGLGLSALANGTRILAHGCASSAWTLVFLAQHAWMAGKMPLAMRERLLGSGEVPLIAGALATIGTAVKVDGGYLVSGRSEWNSAIAHSSWASLKARLDVDGELLNFYLPVSDVQREDRWHTAGMRGTSSDTFVATDVFVTDDLAVPMSVLATSSEPHPDEPFIDYPYIATVSITCSGVVLGAAEEALRLFEDKMRTRVLVFSADERQADQPFAQMRLGEAHLKMTMARELWDSCIREMDDRCGTGGTMTVAQRVGIRAKCALVVQECRDVIALIMNAAGGSSYFLSAPLQRIQRDVEVLKSHAMFDWDRTAQLQGRLRLGMRAQPTDLV